MKRHEAWRAILSARTDVDRLVATAVGDYPERAPVRPSGGEAGTSSWTGWRDPGTTQRSVTEVPGAAGSAGTGAASGSRTTPITDDERRALADLNRRVQDRVIELDRQLAPELGHEEATKALVLYLDERIMERLPDYLRLSWPLLQLGYTRSATGGDDFYRFVNELRAKPSTPSFVFEVYYFCLANGFIGRYANDLASIERYQQWLAEAIELPRVSSDTPDTAEVSIRTTKPMSAWQAHAISLAVVVLITASLTWLSNY
jgi:type IV/VI secretion system ImpK/VasF family protein